MVQGTTPSVFRRVFENAGAVTLKNCLIGFWTRASTGYVHWEGDDTDTYTDTPRETGPVGDETTITVSGRSYRPRSEAEKAELLADPDWVAHVASMMGVDPSHEIFTSPDFWEKTKYDSTDLLIRKKLSPMEFRIRDLGATRAELVATCQDRELEPHFDEWLKDMARLFPIDAKINGQGEEPAAAGPEPTPATTPEQIEAALPTTPGRKRGGRKRSSALNGQGPAELQAV